MSPHSRELSETTDEFLDKIEEIDCIVLFLLVLLLYFIVLVLLVLLNCNIYTELIFAMVHYSIFTRNVRLYASTLKN